MCGSRQSEIGNIESKEAVILDADNSWLVFNIHAHSFISGQTFILGVVAMVLVVRIT